MITIRLAKSVWTFDENDRIGEVGGFAMVFGGASEEHGPIAVKRLSVFDDDSSAVRESKMVEALSANPASDHIMPFLD